MTVEDRFPSYRAPQQNRQILCVPSWPAIGESLASQRDAIAKSKVDVLGVPLGELAAEARCALLAQALAYTRTYTEVEKSPSVEQPLILTGHQPELVHSGVWLKNFAAARLAEEVGGTAISLVIDNDLCRSPSVQVPIGSLEQPRTVEISYDQLQQEVPYEERTIADRAVWNSFGKRVSQAIESLIAKPLLAGWWAEVVALSAKTTNLGLAIAQARHGLERAWGSSSLEIPQSQVCQTAPFHRFALHLLSNATRLRHDYNGALAEYRQVHRLRSAAQPLPDLVEVDVWVETPFWFWTQEKPTRQALFVQPCTEGLRLSDRQGWEETLPLEIDAALQRLADWQQAGIKLRTRALITTLYARLLLADTFIHGIGGAKYDQVTDRLCLRFFGIEPPSFVTLTGTLRLPIEHREISPTRISELRRGLRRLRFHPEAFVGDISIGDVPWESLEAGERLPIEAWVEQKIRAVQIGKTESNAAERHRMIIEANAGLQPWLAPQREQLQQELAAAIAQSRTNQLLESREYPFCLFPHDYLRDFLLDFSSAIP